MPSAEGCSRPSTCSAYIRAASSSTSTRPDPTSRRARDVPIQQVFDLPFLLWGELATFSREELDAVVRIGVVRGADDAAGRCPQARGERGDARRWQDAEVYYVRAAARDAGREGAGEHLAREARVAPDHDPAAERLGCGETEASGRPPAADPCWRSRAPRRCRTLWFSLSVYLRSCGVDPEPDHLTGTVGHGDYGRHPWRG